MKSSTSQVLKNNQKGTIDLSVQSSVDPPKLQMDTEDKGASETIGDERVVSLDSRTNSATIQADPILAITTQV
jgi:hypothetical protein